MPVQAIGFDALPGMATALASYALFGDGAGKGVLAPGFKQLVDATLAADGAFDTGANGLDQSFAHLLIVAGTRATDTSAGDIGMRFNGDATAGHYGGTLGFWSGSGGVTNAYNATSQNAAFLGAAANANDTANDYGSCVVFIPDYANASRMKSYISLAGHNDVAAPTNSRFWVIVGAWTQTSAINQLSMSGFNFTATLKAGSRVTIYGLG